MISSTNGYPAQVSPTAYAPDQDPAYGLAYSTQVLETDGFPAFLSATEAPQLVQAAGGQLVPSAQLQAQIDDAARVLAADPASAPVVQRVRNSMNTLAQPPSPPVSRSLLNNIATGAGILGVILGILPALGFLVSPWLILGVVAVGVATLVAQYFNEDAVGRKRERERSEHETAILALLQRAQEVRAQQAALARPAAHVTLDAPTASSQ